MSNTAGAARPYPHPHVNDAWLSRRREDIIEPTLPIIDAHHHLWERGSGRYLLDELRADLGSGHNVGATVFIQCGYGYRSDGPVGLRPVGETERIAAIAAAAVQIGAPGICAALSVTAIFVSVTAWTRCWRPTSRRVRDDFAAFGRVPDGMPRSCPRHPL